MNNRQRFSGKWETKRLGEIAHIKTGSKNNEDKNENGQYPFFVRSAIVERINSYCYDGEAILVPGEGGIESIFHYINGRFDYHQRVYMINRFVDGVFGKFIYYIMTLQFGSHAMQNTVKATVDSLRLPTFKNFSFSIPKDVAEQRAIAEVLSDVDGLLNALEALIAKKRAIKQATMQQLLTGKTRLPGFSGAWERGILADFGVFRSGSGFPLAFQGHQSGTYPFFKVSDLNGKGNQLFMNSANHYINEDVRRKLGAIRFEPGSIVFAKIGAAIFLERKRLLSQESCLDNNMMAFTLTNDSVCPRFFHYMFLRIELGKLVSTTALPALSGRHIGAVSILIPPIAEQHAIASVLSDMDAEITALEQRRDKTRAIKQGMMQQLLTGRVRLSESRIDTDDADDAD